MSKTTLCFPIDIVYLWVDGRDKKFVSLKNRYLHGFKQDKYIDDTSDKIFIDNCELKYSLRSLEQNAPWINHIYIVTPFGQVPDWLNTKNKKITVVPQEDILPNDAGPIFNSCAVEASLANIKGLSEHFILANDDMFFNMPTKPDYFFDKNGCAKLRCIYRKNGKIVRDKKVIYLRQLINSADEIEKAFNVSLHSYKCSHGIDPYIKSSMKECYEHPILFDAINNTRYHKFRDETDVHRLIFNLYDIVNNRAKVIISHSKHVGHHKVLDFIYNLLHFYSIKNSTFFCEDAIKSKLLFSKAKIICINEGVNSSDLTHEHNRLFFETKFPNKSKFEK